MFLNAASISQPVQDLLKCGVSIPSPCTVDVSASVRPEHIAAGAVIHAGCRIWGSETSIGPGCVLGEEGPATVENCQLGSGVSLRGGYFSGSVFLAGSSMGGSAQVRPGTLLEEEARGGHCVGFKQTILLPYVTAGSLINFCDALMAGGTGPDNHSEIGSSYVHFNFTPHGDKATASLVGDVPRGVMLDQAPIFLGGQGGLVGPARIEFGCVVPAGVVCREDALEAGHLVASGPGGHRTSRRYDPRVYSGSERLIRNNLTYIGNIHALKVWYALVRKRTMEGDRFERACYTGALRVLDLVLEERIRRFGDLVSNLAVSAARIEGADSSAAPRPGTERLRQQRFVDNWSAISDVLRRGPKYSAGSEQRDRFMEAWERIEGVSTYTKAIEQVSPEVRGNGTRWLQAIVDSFASVGGRGKE